MTSKILRQSYVLPFVCYLTHQLTPRASSFSIHRRVCQPNNFITKYAYDFSSLEVTNSFSRLTPNSQNRNYLISFKANLSTNSDTTPNETNLKSVTNIKSKKKTKKQTSNIQNKTTSSDPMDNNIQHVPKKYIPTWFHPKRTRILTEPATLDPFLNKTGKSVIYWMQRDVRTVDNWALLFSLHMAKELKVPLRVVHVLPSPEEQLQVKQSVIDNDTIKNQRMTERYASFLLGGLKLVQKELNEMDVELNILCSDASGSGGGNTFYEYASKDKCNAKLVICDFSPLRMFRKWMEEEAAPLLSKDNIPLYQVDAHNIVPVWVASNKREVGARTLRPKINKNIPEFMTHFPSLQNVSNMTNMKTKTDTKMDWDAFHEFLKPDPSVPHIKWAKPGTQAALNQFHIFQTNGLKNFDTLRNDPNHKHICSNLSPWINFGHVSFQRLALEVRGNKKYPNGTAAYIEEGVVRRELSDNFVYYCPDHYDSLHGAAQWAQDSLQLHIEDKREYIYTLQQFESGATHDDLWNAAQIQLLQEGKMHGFVSTE